jgi:protein ImuB
MHHGEVRVCIADGPRVSSALAHAMRKDVPVVVPEGKNAEAIRALPIRALPIDDRTVQWLVRLGLVRIGDLQKLPERGLATRLGAAHAEVMALLAGDDTAPLLPYVPKDVPEERAELEYGIERSEALVFVAKMLCDRLEARLAGRAMAATRLELELTLDRAVAREAELPSHASLVLSSPAPLSLAGEMLSLVRSRIESWSLVAPVLAVTLRATELARKDGRALDLFEPIAKADRTLPRLVAELAAEIGPELVGILALADTWIPEARSALRPFGHDAAPRVTLAPLVSLAPEPSRILAHPSRLEEDAGPTLHLVRLEASEWWRLGVRARDSFAAWLPAERRLAWVDVDVASGDSLVKGWFD